MTVFFAGSKSVTKFENIELIPPRGAVPAHYLAKGPFPDFPSPSIVVLTTTRCFLTREEAVACVRDQALASAARLEEKAARCRAIARNVF